MPRGGDVQPGPRPPGAGDAHRATLHTVSERAAQMLKWAEQNNAALLTIALDHLTLGRAALYTAILEGSSLHPCSAPLQHAVDGLATPAARPHPQWPSDPRLAAESHRPQHRPRERAERPGRGLGDRRARSHETPHGRHPPPPLPPLLPRSAVSLGIPATDSAAARGLVEKCGYGRRKEELEDAERAISGSGA